MELYELPQGWAWMSFDKVFGIVPISNSKIAQGEYLSEGKLPVIDQGQNFIGGYTNQVEKQVLVDLPVIIFGDHTTIVKYVDFDFVTGADGVKVLKPSILFIAKYLYYYLQAVELPNRGYGRHFQHVRQLQYPLPPLAEQERIVEAIEAQLSRIEAGVESVRNAQRALRRYKASVLNAACTGQLVPQDPTDEPAALLLERILTERRERWETEQREKYAAQNKPLPKNWQDKYVAPAAPDTTDLPELPEGWVWASVEQVSQFLRYGSSAKTSNDSDGIPVLRMGNIQDGKLDLRDLKYLPYSHEEFPTLLLKAGDLLFNRTNSAELVGKSAVYEGLPNRCSYASYLISVRVLTGYSPKILSFTLNSNYGRQWIASVVSQQVGQANVNGTKLSALRVPLASLTEQDRIVAEVERRLSMVAALEQTMDATLKRAARLRQSVLRQAFRGELVAQDPADLSAEALLARIANDLAAPRTLPMVP
jgi:type I restriction enzyme S subunit